ncbi:conserved hypothetical protein [Nitrosococcus halophilus Nc 4]|uniref:Transmembrane protein (PGPGW) n=1 Tax=Nitrosococcus halophilus (strain Nc4) TaxID=472759 RepID=D5BWN3_NITHN|nr:hypothetical protein [Nitrosococcus halophilus]ADE15690.1 conserved hypothetical protein [Nitrosococcus halophilus Nc 4]
MLQRWKRKWKKDVSQLANEEPGKRFTRHHKRQQDKNNDKSWETPLYITLGILLVAIGILISIPPIGVPGFILTLVGLSLLISRLKSMAIFLDKIELIFYRIIKYWKERKNNK